jgi:cytidylate kinase
MIITLDGPAGAGKSTVAKRLAVRLTESTGKPFEYLDTGSMYRAITLLGIRSDIDWQKPEELERLAESADVNIFDGRTFLNGEDVTEAVRSPSITEKTRFAANNPVIRQIMVEQQRNIARRFLAENRGLVTEGRDQGTVVFPDADCKFFLTATPEERARRRLGELQQRGIVGDFDEIYRQITERDARDAARPVGPLCEPPDAHRIVSDGMTIDEVVDIIERQSRTALDIHLPLHF